MIGYEVFLVTVKEAEDFVHCLDAEFDFQGVETHLEFWEAHRIIIVFIKISERNAHILKLLLKFDPQEVQRLLNST